MDTPLLQTIYYMKEVAYEPLLGLIKWEKNKHNFQILLKPSVLLQKIAHSVLVFLFYIYFSFMIQVVTLSCSGKKNLIDVLDEKSGN